MSTQQLIQQAKQHHGSGQLREAEQIYRQILQHDPNNAEALSLLGALAGQLGHVRDAVELIGRAASLSPNDFKTFCNLATALRQAGRDGEAIDAYRRAAAIREDAGVLTALANLYWKFGKGNDAEDALTRAIQLNPRSVTALHGLGSIYLQLGIYSQAIEMFKRALEVNPNLPDVQREYAVALHQVRSYDECEAACRRVLEQRPNDIVALNHLALTLRGLRRFDEAVPYLDRMLALPATTPEETFNRGLALSTLNRIPEAEQTYREALRQNPQSIPAQLNLAVMCSLLGRNDEALEFYDQVVAASPNYAVARMHRAISLMLAGRLEEGFNEYVWRWQAVGIHEPPRYFAQPLWEKQGVAGKTVLVHSEQGFGDAIQFCRYVPMIARRGAKVILEVRPDLVELMKSLKGVKQLIPRGEPLPKTDLHVPLMDLPRTFNTVLKTIPADVPYLSADPEKVKAWEQRLAQGEQNGRPALRVGLVWAGSPTHQHDWARSVRLAQYAPLARAAGDRVRFIAVQKGDAAKQAANPPAGMNLTDFSDELRDFTDTAALLMNLDLLITVDTSVAHLAGALARPVWTIHATSVDWRWLEHRDDSPWYPTMRLFRQTKLGAWDPVIEKVAEELRKLAGLGAGDGGQ